LPTPGLSLTVVAFQASSGFNNVQASSGFNNVQADQQTVLLTDKMFKEIFLHHFEGGWVGKSRGGIVTDLVQDVTDIFKQDMSFEM
jgi:hypothetical protein